MARRSQARHRRSQRWLPVVLGVAIALGLTGGAVAMMGGDDAAPAQSAQTTSASPSTSLSSAPPTQENAATPPGAPTAPAEAIACRDELTAADAVVDAARTGVDHWSGHVGARTDMLSGKITPDEARAIWKKTKLPGPEDQAAFTERDDTYQALAGACAEVDIAAVPAEFAHAVNQCLDRARDAEAAVEAGRAAMADWADHLANMAAFAGGDFDAAHAQDMWEEAWSKAPKNINAFRAADKALASAPECTLDG